MRRRRTFEKALRAKYDFSLFYPRAVNEMRMLAAAAEKAKSLDPVKVAAALEGMEFDVFDGGKGFMRKDDHQFFQPIYIASFGERTEKEPFDEEKTGWGWKLVAKIDTAADHASDHLQDGPAELDRFSCHRRISVAPLTIFEERTRRRSISTGFGSGWPCCA